MKKLILPVFFSLNLKFKKNTYTLNMFFLYFYFPNKCVVTSNFKYLNTYKHIYIIRGISKNHDFILQEVVVVQFLFLFLLKVALNSF